MYSALQHVYIKERYFEVDDEKKKDVKQFLIDAVNMESKSEFRSINTVMLDKRLSHIDEVYKNSQTRYDMLSQYKYSYRMNLVNENRNLRFKRTNTTNEKPANKVLNYIESTMEYLKRLPKEKITTIKVNQLKTKK